MAVEASRGYVIDRARFLALMARHAELAQATIRHLCSLLRYTTEHIETIALYGLEERLARFLLSQALEAGEGAEPGRPHLHLALNQSDLAGLLGASRSKVNRAISALEKAGAITRRGKVMVCDPARLLRLAEPRDG